MRFFAENLFFHELLHFLLALVIGLWLVKKFGELRLLLVALLVSFLVDIDHLTEGFLIYGLAINQFLANFAGNFFVKSGKMTLFFHSWELLLIILWLGKRFRHWPLAVAVASAAGGHYLVDQLVYTLTHGISLFEYFLIYRAIHGFDFWELCGRCQV